MAKWNDIPYNENDTPQQKADQFDAQVAENSSPQSNTPALDNYEANRDKSK